MCFPAAGAPTSEILFSGDAGDTTASRPSRHYGIEWTNDYRPLSWLSLEGDIAVTHARFRGDDPDQAALYASLAGFPAAQIGNSPGNYIPGAPNMIASAGIKLGEKTGWFSALRYRFFGPRPLTEDNAFVSPATGLLNGQLGYRFDNGWRIQIDAFNLPVSNGWFWREADIRRSGEVRKVPKPGISPEPLDARAVRSSEPRRGYA